MTPEVEEWRTVVDYEGFYEVSSLGRIKSVARLVRRKDGTVTPVRERIMKTPVNSEGRPSTGLCREGRMQSVKVQNVVAAAFLGDKRDGFNLCHNNGDRTDNRVSNLRYDTSSENALDRVRHGNDPNATKTHCPAGHAYDAANTYLHIKSNQRSCRACARQRASDRATRKRVMQGA